MAQASLTPGGFQDIFNRAVQASKKHLRRLSADVSVPAVMAREHQALFAHIWVDRLFKDFYPIGVCISDFEMHCGLLLKGYTFSPAAEILLQKYQAQFEDWLRSLRQPPQTTAEWRLGMAPAECILLQMALAKGSSEGMRLLDVELKSAVKDQVFDYVEMLTNIKAATPATTATSTPKAANTNPSAAAKFFRR